MAKTSFYEKHKFTLRTLLIGIVFFGISVINTVHDMTTMVILGQEFPDLSSTFKGFVMAIDNILALFMLPLFGKLSDNCTSKWGKRKPFVLVGTLVACGALLLFPIALNIPSLPMFMTFICMFLIGLGIYRSAGVSIVSDVTIKPLRSKANALINLMGAIAYLLGQQIVGILFKDPVNGVRPIPLSYLYIAYVVVALIALVVYIMFVKEVKLSKEREEQEKELGIDTEEVVEKTKVILTADKKKSLILILASICLWTFGYNVLTTYYPEYAKTILATADGSFTLATTVAAGAGLIGYIPIGILASKIGRRKTIMLGFTLSLVATISAMFVANFYVMMGLFVFIGVGQAMVVVNTLPMVVEFSNKNTIGQFTGFYYIATQLASALTPLIGGIIFDVCASAGIAGTNGLKALFPYATVFILLAFIPILFTKFGDSKPIPPKSKLEAFGD